MNKELSPVAAAELNTMLEAEADEDRAALDYLGDREREYMGTLCTKIMQKIVCNRRQGYIEHRVTTNVDSEEVFEIPEWLKDRVKFVYNFFTDLGYKVTINFIQERHGFGDWNRWHGADLRISW